MYKTGSDYTMLDVVNHLSIIYYNVEWHNIVNALLCVNRILSAKDEDYRKGISDPKWKH